MGKSYRPKRLGEEIRKIVSELLVRGELKDPGFVGMIGINAVDVTNDGSYATLYVSVLAYDPKGELSQEKKEGVINAFNKSKGFLRSEIGKRIKVRFVPELIFKLDTSMEYGMKMDRLIESLDIPDDDPEEQTEEQ